MLNLFKFYTRFIGEKWLLFFGKKPFTYEEKFIRIIRNKSMIHSSVWGDFFFLFDCQFKIQQFLIHTICLIRIFHSNMYNQNNSYNNNNNDNNFCVRPFVRTMTKSILMIIVVKTGYNKQEEKMIVFFMFINSF